MNRAFAKSGRISQIERLLLGTRAHLSQAEIARRCDVHRSTIGRLLNDMIKNEIPVRYDEQGLIYIERTAYLSTIKLKLHEAVAVFLAGRLLARYSDKPNAHTVEALDKLGVALQGVMPTLGQHITSTSTTLRGRLPKQADDHQRMLEKLSEAWAGGKKVQLWYRPLHARKAYQHTFAPYFLEPSGIGYSVYAIGMAEPPHKLRTRKLERIERIVSTDEPFEVPAGFDPNKLLEGAWGIWFDEDDQPTPIALRFSGDRALRRMGETCWHPSERKERDAEGRLIWTAEIDEPQEMLPWIRGWGADCEVLEPQELREKVMGEVRRQMRVYGIGATERRADEPDDDLFRQLFGG
jgi:predicted DNA-binding transcriptional regulator YafY